MIYAIWQMHATQIYKKQNSWQRFKQLDFSQDASLLTVLTATVSHTPSLYLREFCITFRALCDQSQYDLIYYKNMHHNTAAIKTVYTVTNTQNWQNFINFMEEVQSFGSQSQIPT